MSISSPAAGIIPVQFMVNVAVFAAAEWTPATLAGLKVWYCADEETHQDAGKTTPADQDGDPVGGWGDLSGNGCDATQATDANRPTLHLNALNGHATVDGDSVDDFMQATVAEIAQPFTVAMVCHRPSQNADRYFSDASGIPRVERSANYLRMTAGTNYNCLVVDDDDYHIFSLVFSGASSFGRKDGVQGGDGDANTQSLEDLFLFSHRGIANWGDLDLAEFLIYGRDISGNDMTALESYLSDKYGISI